VNNGGGKTLTEEGKFALAHVLSMLISDPTRVDAFDNFIWWKGNGGHLGNLSYARFRWLVGEIGTSTALPPS
jgi:hypothetical protein